MCAYPVQARVYGWRVSNILRQAILTHTPSPFRPRAAFTMPGGMRAWRAGLPVLGLGCGAASCQLRARLGLDHWDPPPHTHTTHTHAHIQTHIDTSIPLALRSWPMTPMYPHTTHHHPCLPISTLYVLCSPAAAGGPSREVHWQSVHRFRGLWLRLRLTPRKRSCEVVTDVISDSCNP